VIARIWHGRTEAAKAEDYLRFLKERALPDYRRTAGNRAAYVLRRIDGPTAHFLTLSFWDSQDAIRGFAGQDIERARYYPEDRGFLLDFEPTVAHYEVFNDEGAS